MTTDLAEKLKELLMECDFETFSTEEIAQQLAPEIEKMLPRWIPVGEGLPKDGELVDVWYLSSRYNMVFRVNGGKDYFISIDGVTTCWLTDKNTIAWTPIMKGPMG